MLYYSEVLKKGFKTEKECVEAESKAKAAEEAERLLKEKKAAERKTRADEVTKARDEAIKAQKHYTELLNKFVRDYGSFHSSVTKEYDLNDLSSMINVMLGWF